MHSQQSEIKLTVASKIRSSTVEVMIFGGTFPIYGFSKTKLIEHIGLLYAKGSLDQICAIKGRYVIVIEDNSIGQTMLINDCFGSIPLYFAKAKECIYISNDLRAFNSKVSIRLNLFHDYYENSFVKQYLKKTFLKDIFLIAGNSILTVKHDDLTYKFRCRRRLFQSNGLSDLTIKECIENYKEKLLASIRDKVNVESVLTLSGGLDSSILLQIVPKESIKHIYSLCTISSLDNQEIERAIELTKSHNLKHDIYPFNFTNSINLHHWNESVIASMDPNASIETYHKYLLSKMIHQMYGTQYALITGIGSDHFNGGHTMTDYSRGSLHESWEDFYVNLKLELYHKDHSYFELLEQLEFEQMEKNTWLKYLKFKHNGMMSGSLLREFSTESFFDLRYICPFLDEDLVELAAQIPKTHYDELFFNKSILREVGKEFLPKSFDNTQKVKHNNSLIAAVSQFYRKIIQENQEEIINRIESSTVLGNVINTDNLSYLLKNVGRIQNNSPLFYNLLLVYNFCLLGDYVNNGSSKYDFSEKISYQSTKNTGNLKSLLDYDHHNFSPNKIYLLLDSIEIFENNGVLMLIQSNSVLRRIENSYLKVIIKHLNPEKTIQQLLDKFQITLKDVKEDLSRLFLDGIIVNK